MKIITTNKKAYFDYEILDTIECGIVLQGDEVKSLRAGHCNLTGSFATIHEGELMLLNVHIAPYSHAYEKKDEDSRRSRKLLVHKRELMRVVGEISKKGITLVPLKIYFNDRAKVKIDLGLCRHKKAASKKQEIKERDITRETRRELGGKYKF